MQQLDQFVRSMGILLVELKPRVITVVNQPDCFALPFARMIINPVMNFECTVLVLLHNMIGNGEHKYRFVVIVWCIKHGTDDVHAVFRPYLQNLVEIGVEIGCQKSLTTDQVGLFPSEPVLFIPLREACRSVIMCLNK